MNRYHQFGALLNQYLVKQDRSPAWLARRLGVNGGTVSRWLNDGTRPGSPETVVLISDILGISGQRDQLLMAAGYGYQARAPDTQSDAQANNLDHRAQPDDLLPPLAPSRPNLPVPTTPFVGRQTELAELARLLNDPTVRLLSILAPGGMGKTRLALELAAQHAARYPHGVYFVPPALQRDVENLPTLLANAVGYQFQPGARTAKQQLFDHLRDKQLLLVLDSFEHQLAGVELLHELLQAAPAIDILVTTRERLRLSGETVFRLSGMDVPEQASSSMRDASTVQLFLQGATRLHPGFEPTEEEWSAIAEICRLTQGMPLAILLAAAWIETLPSQEIAREISQSMNFLAADLRDLPQHQRSIAAILAQTWEQLTGAERALLPYLSLFHGGFTRQAVQAVSGASLATLNTLTDKALLWRDANGRYAIHELLGQYAEERLVALDLAETGRNAHAAYYTTLLGRYTGKLKSREQSAALDELEWERENLRAAWHWAVEHTQLDRIAQAVEGLCCFYQLRGHYNEGIIACQAATTRLLSLVPATSDQAQLLATLLNQQSIFNMQLGRTEVARQLCQQSLSLLDDLAAEGHNTQADHAATLLQMGTLMWHFDMATARDMLQESLALYRALGDEWTTAAVLRELGRVTFVTGDYQEAEAYAQESLALRRKGNDQAGMPATLALLNWLAVAQGNYEQAESYAQEHYRISRLIRNPILIANSFFNLGVPLLHTGRFVEALAKFDIGQEIAEEVGDRQHWNTCNIWRAEAKLHLGQYTDADALAQLALTTARDIGLYSHQGEALVGLAQVRLVRGAYQEAEQLLRESQVVYEAIQQPTKLIPVYAGFVYIAYHTNDQALAQRSLAQLVHFALQKRDHNAIMQLLPMAALLMLNNLCENTSEHTSEYSSREGALEYYTAALCYPYVARSHWYADMVGSVISNLTGSLPADVAQAACVRGKTRAIEAIIAELV